MKHEELFLGDDLFSLSNDDDPIILDLADVRGLIWSVLDKIPDLVLAVREAVEKGRIRGCSYYGKCSCFKGTIGSLLLKRSAPQDYLIRYVLATRGIGIDPMGVDELFVMSLQEGDTPETSAISRYLLLLIDDWIAARKDAQHVA